jgi:heme/copper-type cytochrome/quinol oxidase subunit 3
MRRVRPTIDVSRLPTVVFGSRDLMWWGTLGFVVIEGFTLAVAAVTYVYLWRNFVGWPPLGTQYPSLLLPTLGAVLYAVSVAPAVWLARASKRLDRGAVRVALVILSVLGLAFCILRWFEFVALNVKWNTNAYGSIVWTILGFHATLIVVEAGEVLGMAVLSFTDKMEAKHFSDSNDLAVYWYFLVLSWLALYVLVYLGPRFM